MYSHPAYLTCMQSTSCEVLGGLDDAQAGIKMSESREELKSLLIKVKEESEKLA